MLEFENDQVPVEAKVDVKVNEGFVMIPLGTYNELLLAASAKPPIKVTIEKWSTYPRIEAEVDKEWLLEQCVKRMREKYSEEELSKFDVLKPDSMYVSSVTIAEATAETKAAIDAEKAAKEAQETT